MSLTLRRWVPFIAIFVIILGAFAYLLTNRGNSLYIPDSDDPAKIYADACAGCHGNRGQGSGFLYPGLESGSMKKNEVERIIRQGSILMPPFKRIQLDTLSKLVDYVYAKKFMDDIKSTPKKRLFSE